MTYDDLKSRKRLLECQRHIEKADCLLLILVILIFTNLSLFCFFSVLESGEELYLIIFRIVCLFGSSFLLGMVLQAYHTILQCNKKLKDLHHKLVTCRLVGGTLPDAQSP